MGIIHKLYSNFKQKRRLRRQLAYCEDILWGAIIQWSWKKTSTDWEIDAKTVECHCAHCEHELEFKKQGQYFFLFCGNCKFISREYFEHEKQTIAAAKYQLIEQLKKRVVRSLS